MNKLCKKFTTIRRNASRSISSKSAKSLSSCLKSIADELEYENENLQWNENLETTEKNRIFTTDTSHKQTSVWIQKDPKTIETLESNRPAYEYRIYSRFIFPRCQEATRCLPVQMKRRRPKTVQFRRSDISNVISSISSEGQDENSRDCQELTKTINDTSHRSENNIRKVLSQDNQ